MTRFALLGNNQKNTYICKLNKVIINQKNNPNENQESVLCCSCRAGVIACQNKQTAEGVTVSPEEIEFAKEGETKEVTITTADAWKISVPEEASWLELSEKSGTGTTKISIKAAANTEWDRSASLTVKAGMYSAKIKVSQAGNGEKVESAIEKLLAIELQKDEVRTGAVEPPDTV